MMQFTVLCGVACLLIQASGASHLPKDEFLPDELVDKVKELQGNINELAGENERLQSLLSEIMEEECVIGPRDCAEILEENPEARTGLHQIELTHKLGALESALVYCDMETDGGGWIVIQRRIDGSINFVRNRQSYADGFGIQAHEFWMGNKLLHQITSRWNYELRVDLEHTNEIKSFATYSTFKVGSEADDFLLELSELVDGEAGDSMRQSVGMKFSTFDHDVDESEVNCAAQHNGAWWYRDCTDANLNGQHLPSGLSADEAMFWYTWQQRESLVAVEMKIRPAELTCPEPKPCPTKAPTTMPDPTTRPETTAAPTTMPEPTTRPETTHAATTMPEQTTRPETTPAATTMPIQTTRPETTPAATTMPEQTPRPRPTSTPTTTPLTPDQTTRSNVIVPVGLHDCSRILNHHPSAPSGEYDIEVLDGLTLIKIRVWCDMETDGGGWTVFQRRKDGSVDFFRNYAFYQQGFGSVSNEFWLGNDNLHLITSHDLYELRVDLEGFDGIVGYARYSIFEIGPGSDGYRLNIGGYNGTAGDSMDYHDGMRFSTYDNDQDISSGNCAEIWEGAWWFRSCFHSNLNAVYQDAYYRDSFGLRWKTWNDERPSMKISEMKVRPIV